MQEGLGIVSLFVMILVSILLMLLLFESVLLFINRFC